MQLQVLLTILANSFLNQSTPIVRVEQGLVSGRVSENGQFYEYLGIPYGTVTVASRFQAPLPAPIWKGKYSAVSANSHCLQRKLLLPGLSGEEDCLKVNIFVPTEASEDNLLPVMFYIHGGGYREGKNSPIIYGPDFLVRHGVLLITVNYRLDVLGFLCLGIKEAPGNAGLKDQIAALRWVKRNIKAFGGDPDNMTIFGESAGAAATSILTISPIADGLFKRAIMQSGSSLSPWSLQYDPIEQASLLAKQLGYDTKDPMELYYLFANASHQELVGTIVPRLKGGTTFSEFIFIPCIERKIPGVESVLNDSPYNIFESGNFKTTPSIMGFNNKEGLFFLSKENQTTLADLEFPRLTMDLEIITQESNNNSINRLSDLYLNGKRAWEDKLKLGDLYSDIYFKYPVVSESLLRSRIRSAVTYNYIFSYDSLLNLPKLASGYGSETGAIHADEVPYIFKIRAASFFYKISDHFMIDRLTKMWTDFAKSGNPTPKPLTLIPTEWLPNNGTELQYLMINKKFSMGPLPRDTKEKFRLWNEIYSKHRRRRFDFKNDT